jgi:hypothetical protein
VVLLELLTGKGPVNEAGNETLHTASYAMLCEPERALRGCLDARVPAAAWARVDGATGALSGRALDLCLVARRCLEAHVHARCTMRDAMPAVVALAATTDEEPLLGGAMLVTLEKGLRDLPAARFF